MEKSSPDLILPCLTNYSIPTHHRIRWPEPESRKLQPKSTSFARISLHRVSRVSLGNLRFDGARRLHRQVPARRRGPSSDRPTDPVSNANHIFAVGPVAAARLSL